MSGIIAIHRPNQFENESSLLEKMTSQLRHRGPDASQIWEEGPIGLGANLLRTTPESRTEQPVTFSPSYRTRALFDGRLDYREDLVLALGKPELINEPDPVLILQAYETWGLEFPHRLFGDYAIVIWDERCERLLAVRDRLGIKPLHYAQQKNEIAFSSEIKPLLTFLDNAPTPNDKMILAFLSFANFAETDHQETFLKEVFRVPPAHYLIYKEGQTELCRYWSPDLTQQNHFQNEAECAEAFREILNRAIKTRMRAAGPAGILLSGGLDSSTIAKLASANSEPSLEAYHYYSHEALSDERSFAKRMAEECSMPLYEFFSHSSDPIALGLDKLLRKLEGPMVSTSQDTEIMQFAQGRQTRVILSGEGGDHLLDEFGFPADLLRQGKFIEFWNKANRFAGDFDIPMMPIAKEAFSHVLPQKLIHFYRWIAKNAPPRWLNQSLLSKTGIRERYVKPAPKPYACSIAQGTTFRDITHPYSVMKWELEEKIWARHGADIRFPMLDSRLVEFILALPLRFRATGRRKSILRAAMKGLLPSAILERRGKADWTSEMDESLVKLCRKSVPEPLANRSGMMSRYIDIPAAKKLVALYLKGNYQLRSQIWFLITMDHWLVQFTQGADYEATAEKEKVSVSPSC